MSDRIFLWSRKLQGRKCDEVTNFSSIPYLSERLFTMMRRHEGVGLAAPQIGVFQRVACIDLIAHSQRTNIILINPVILECRGEQTVWEGCLSIPGKNTRARVKRSQWVKARYQDIQGNWHEIVGEGFLAQAIQHEIGHLDGKFFIDMVGPLRRKLIIRNFLKSVGMKNTDDLEMEYIR